MAQITIFPKSADASGMVRLYMFVSIKNQPGWFPTKVKVLKASWDQGKQKIDSRQLDYRKFNGILATRRGQLQKAFDALEYEGTAPAVELVREKYNAILNHELTGVAPVKKKVYTLDEYWDIYVNERRNVCAWSYLRNFKAPLAWIKEVKPKPRFGDITMQFYLEWVNVMVEEGEIENNTISGYASKLISIMGAALIDPRTKHQDIPIDFKLFNDMYIKPKVLWLDWDTELLCLEEFTPLPEDLPLKQFFLFQCYAGLRHSDAFNLKPENFIRKKDEVFLDYMTIKTKLDHNIQLNAKAVEILKAWNYRVPRVYQHDLNAGIKRIAKAAGEKWKKEKRESGLLNTVEKVRYSGSERLISILPKYEMITTHTGRRTFGRRWAERGGEIRYLSKYYGHASVQQTEDYIGWSTVEVNKEMLRVM